MSTKRNPWFVLLCWLIGIPLGLYLFTWGIALSMGGGADIITVLLFVVAVVFVLYKAIRHRKKQKDLPKHED